MSRSGPQRRPSRVALLAVACCAAGGVAFLLPPVPRLVRLAAASNENCTPTERVSGLLGRVRQRAARTWFERRAVLRTSDPAGFELWSTPGGEYWTPKGNQELLPLVLAMQSRRIYGRVAPGSVVLDCGANVGVYTRQALSQGAKIVIAIEPVPENIECLRRNLTAGIAAGRVIVYPKGVWDRETELPIHRNARNSAADSFVFGTASGQPARLPVTTIDRIVAELKLPRVDSIKMNIEGAELKALHGARQTLAAFRPALAIAVDHHPEDPKEVTLLVRRAWPGYRSSCLGSCFEVRGALSPEVLYFQ